MSKFINCGLLLTALVLCSCRTSKIIEVPIETIKTQYIDKVKYDSIYSKDSIYIMRSGDTVYNTKTQYIYKYRYLRDTIQVTDTIPKIVHITETQYINKLYSWQRGLMIIGVIPLILFIIYAGKLIKQLIDKLKL